MINLRPFTTDDEDIMLDILTDSRVSASFMLPDFAEKQDALGLFHRMMTLSLEETRYVRGICLHNAVIGFVNDVEIADGTIELGYVIHPDYQRQGYMTQALMLAIPDLFERGYTKVIAGAFEENTPSIRVMEHAGMKPLPQTEEIEYRGKVHHCVYYSKEKQV